MYRSHPAISIPAANVFQGHYRYMQDLHQLSATSSSSPSSDWPQYQSPIRLEELAPLLASHPDQSFAAFIIEGLANGFRIGYSLNRLCLRCRTINHPSAFANEQVIDDKITAEVTAGRLLGPVPPQLAQSVHTSPLGLVPKAHRSGSWRMICDLSSPRGNSVNDGIRPELCSLQYATVDKAVEIIQQLGRDTQLVKLDIKDAYRIVPVHPSDYHLLGIQWRGNTYVDRALPFGLRSAPKIFNAVADIIAWVLTCQGIRHQLHYLDDFLFIAPPHCQQRDHIRTTALHTLDRLGVPVALNKTEGPSTALTFLGIYVDCHHFELRLPAEKLTRLQDMVQTWAGRRSCTRKELESLIGHLVHAATVIPQGRVFLRQLFALLSLDRAHHHYLRLNAGTRADLEWWKVFLCEWNGTSFFPTTIPSIEVVSDASGVFGCGAFSIPHGWFQLQWPADWQSISITVKELVPIVIAAALWGHQWSRKCICFRSDNMAVVDLLRSCSSQEALLMHLLRCLTFYSAFFRFQFRAAHVPGIHNSAADAISRNNISLFLSFHPQSQYVPVSQSVVDLLVRVRPDWGSQTWIHLFRSSLTGEFPQQPELLTSQAGAATRHSVGSSTCPSFR